MRQAIHGKSRIRYESKCVGVRNGHPSRQQHQCAIRLPDDEMLFATVLLAAENTHSVTVSRMKRVEDLHLKTQTPGIMTLARRASARPIYQSRSGDRRFWLDTRYSSQRRRPWSLASPRRTASGDWTRNCWRCRSRSC